MRDKKFPSLLVENLNPNVVVAKYAVRGEILDVKAKIASEMKAGVKYPFTEFCELNIGNPQTFKMKPVSFFRDVLAATTAPWLMEKKGVFSKDVQTRAQEYIKHFNSVGCYSDSTGNPLVSRSVADFISKRDGIPAKAENVFLYNGASEAIASVMQTINLPGKRTGFMIPIPQYPLYSAQVQLLGAEFVGYYLDEANGWELDEAALNKSYDEAKSRGVDVRFIIVIKPSNPTGAIFSKKSIEALFKFTYNKCIVVLADEVYQENIYTAKKHFISFREVLSQQPA